MGLGKGRLVSRPTENAALGKCKDLTSRLTREQVIDHYKRRYGIKWLDMMSEVAREYVYREI